MLTIDRRNFILYDYVKCIDVLQHHLMPLYPTLSMVQTLRHWSLFFLWFFLQVDIGAHTIGVERCNFFNNRLFNCIRKGNSDSSLNIKNEMPKHMKQHNYRRTGSWEFLTFDYHYFSILQQQGLLQSDAARMTNKGASNIFNEMPRKKVNVVNS